MIGILEDVFATSDFRSTFQRGSGLELVVYADSDYASRLIVGGCLVAPSRAWGHACAGFGELRSAWRF